MNRNVDYYKGVSSAKMIRRTLEGMPTRPFFSLPLELLLLLAVAPLAWLLLHSLSYFLTFSRASNDHTPTVIPQQYNIGPPHSMSLHIIETDEVGNTVATYVQSTVADGHQARIDVIVRKTKKPPSAGVANNNNANHTMAFSTTGSNEERKKGKNASIPHSPS